MNQNIESVENSSSLSQSDLVPQPLTEDRRVLFAWDAANPRPILALLRAHAYAQMLGAELFILAVFDVMHQSSTNPIQPWFQFDRAQRFLNSTLPDLEDSHVQMKSGIFAELVALASQDLDADLVVIPPAEKNAGKQANQIATTAEVKVLVARTPQFRNTVVAATDLSHPGYPVVTAAGLFRQYLSAELVLIHNVVPVVFSGGLEAAWPLTGAPSARSLSRTTHRLRQVAQSCGACSEALVAVAWNTANTILKTAHERDADLVVIGTRPRTRWEQLLDSGVTVRVIREARQSVLIVPAINRRGQSSLSVDLAGSAEA